MQLKVLISQPPKLPRRTGKAAPKKTVVVREELDARDLTIRACKEGARRAFGGRAGLCRAPGIGNGDGRLCAPFWFGVLGPKRRTAA